MSYVGKKDAKLIMSIKRIRVLDQQTLDGKYDYSTTIYD
jgi:hypothetical protein